MIKKRRAPWFLLVVVVLGLAGCAALGLGKGAQRKALKETAQTYYEALEAQDTEKVLSFYSESLLRRNPKDKFGVALQGRQYTLEKFEINALRDSEATMTARLKVSGGGREATIEHKTKWVRIPPTIAQPWGWYLKEESH